MHTLSRLAKYLLSRQCGSMPAKNLYREAKEGIYSHIYNKGAEKRIIFNDEADYKVFLGYLEDYLTVPQDPESIKKSFTVHGRIFQGTPHQPKNYFNRVDLIAYSLMPGHFHLLLYQKTRDSLESFMRSLCTRYSMYFNKKYQHTGALFEGPYKSVQIMDELRLLYLTHYLHHSGGLSSYAQYLGARIASWVKPKVIQSFFDKVKTDLFKETHSYKDFVEKYDLNQKEKELMEGITFESETQHLESRNFTKDVENYPRGIPTESSEKIHLGSNLKPLQRIPEFLTTVVVFLLLVTLGIRNIMVFSAKNPNHPPTSSVLSKTNPSPTPTQSGPTPAVLSKTEKIEEIKPKIILTIKIDDSSASSSARVNIRQHPTINSEKIGAARDGDTFEFVSMDSGWYEVKLVDGSNGFISGKYIEKGGINN